MTIFCSPQYHTKTIPANCHKVQVILVGMLTMVCFKACYYHRNDRKNNYYTLFNL